MQTPKRLLAAMTVVLLVLSAAPRHAAEAAPHRARAAKHTTAKPLKTKRTTAARRSADEPADAPTAEAETKRQRKSEPKPEPKSDHAPTKPAIQGDAASQVEDSEDPPVRKRKN